MTNVELLEPRLMLAGSPPLATLNIGDVLAAGGSEHMFSVVYTDPDGEVDVSSIDSLDLLVTGPGGYSQIATFVSRSSDIDGSPRTATYKITAPGGSWDPDDAFGGTDYTVSMRANQVCDPQFNYVPAGVLGTFKVMVEDVTAPTAAATAGSVDNTSTDYVYGSVTPYQFTVVYHDNIGLDLSTIGAPGPKTHLLVFGPGYGPGGQAADLLLPVDSSDPHNVVATYIIPAPAGSWTIASNGTYTIQMQADQVRDTSAVIDPTYLSPGLRVAAGTIGSFTVNLDTAPKATVIASNIGPGDLGETIFSIQVDYEALHGKTIPNTTGAGGNINVNNVVITQGANTYTPFYAFPGTPDANKLTVIYYFAAPGGAWDPADGGLYTVGLGADPVHDNATPTTVDVAVLNGSFSASFDTTAPTFSLTASDLYTSTSPDYFFTVTYLDNVGMDLSSVGGSDVVVAGMLNITGINLLPNIDGGSFSPQATLLNGKQWFSGVVGGVTWYIGWDGVDTWWLSRTPGASTNPGWKRTDPSPLGDYSSAGGAELGVPNVSGIYQPATFQQGTLSSNGRIVTAMYRITASGENWQSSDNTFTVNPGNPPMPPSRNLLAGIQDYHVSLNGGEIADTSGNTIAAQMLGTFGISLETTPPSGAALVLDHPDVQTPFTPFTLKNTFTVDASFAAALVNAELPTSLKTAFSNNGIALSDSAAVTVDSATIKINGVGLSPDINNAALTLQAGSFNGKAWYSGPAGSETWYLAWDGVDSWILSKAKGVATEPGWKLTNPRAIAGTYTPIGGSSTGTLTLTLEDFSAHVVDGGTTCIITQNANAFRVVLEDGLYYATTLINTIMTGSLKNAFSANNVPLSDNASIVVESVGIQVDGVGLSPNINGADLALQQGAFNGKAWYSGLAGGETWYLAWDGASSWVLSRVKGVASGDAWGLTSFGAASGTYSPVSGSASGTFTLAIGDIHARIDDGRNTYLISRGAAGLDVVHGYAFTVNYRDLGSHFTMLDAPNITQDPNSKVDMSTLDDNDVYLQRSDGLTLTARFIGLDPATSPGDGNIVIARYVATAPGDVWDVADTGFWTAYLRGAEVADVYGNYNATSDVQTLTMSAGTDGGTFALSYLGSTTADLPFDVSLAALQAAVRALHPDLATTVVTTVGGLGVDYVFTTPGVNCNNILIFNDLLTDGGVAEPATIVHNVQGGLLSSTPIGTFIVGDPIAPTAIAPVASLTPVSHMVDSVSVPVRYSDNQAIDASTIDDSDLFMQSSSFPNPYSGTVTPAFFNTSVLLSADDVVDGPTRLAFYSTTGNNQMPFDSTYNGRYEFSVYPGSVNDTSGNGVTGGALSDIMGATASVLVNIPTLVAAPIATATKNPYQFTVIYDSYFNIPGGLAPANNATATGLDMTSFDSSDVTVTGPWNFRQTARMVSATVTQTQTLFYVVMTPAGPVVMMNIIPVQAAVVYEIQPPSTSQGWTENDAGEYNVIVNANQVFDEGGVMGGGKIDDIYVTIGNKPFATARTQDLLNLNDAQGNPLSTYEFQVRFIGNYGIDVSTILDSADTAIYIVAPDGVTEIQATLVTDSIYPAGDGSPRLARYTITAPGGTWDIGDRGIYTIRMQPGAIFDLGLEDEDGSIIVAPQYVNDGTIGSFIVGDIEPPTATAPISWVVVTGMTTSIDFWTVYADNDAVDASTIGQGDISLLGPNNILRSTNMTLLDSTADGPRRMVQYSAVLPGGREWNSNDNGNYVAFVETGEIEDVSGNGITGGVLRDSANVDMDVLVDIPVLAAPDIMFTNSNPYQFIVTYNDYSLIDPNVYGVQGIDPNSLDNNDIIVTATIGGRTYSQSAVCTDTILLDYDPVNNVYTQVAGIYTVTAPMWIGEWNEQAAGEYTILVQKGEILSPAGMVMIGQTAAGDKIGSFHVRIGDYPVGTLTANDVLTLPSGAHNIEVIWYDNNAIDAAHLQSLPSGGLEVVAPDGTYMTVQLVSITPATDASPIQAIYSVAPPSGTWTTADIGDYTVSVKAGEVLDDDGNAAPAMVLGTFSVGDRKRPTANLYMATTRFTGIQNYVEFVVRYVDNVAIDVSTIDSLDIRVLGPNSFNQLAEFKAIDVNMDGPSRLVTYRITPADGSFNYFDNGSYRFVIQGNQVSDTWSPANFVTLLTAPQFVVDIPLLIVSNVDAVNTNDHVFSVVYSDPFGNGLSIASLGTGDVTVTGPGGYSQPGTIVSYVVVNQAASPTGMIDTQVMVTYSIPAPGGQWNQTNAGTYTVTVNPGQVQDTLGNEVAHGLLGTFRNRIGEDPIVDTPVVVPTVTTPVGGGIQFTVTYHDNIGIDVTSLGNDEIQITGPNGYSAMASFVGYTVQSGGRTVVVTYEARSVDPLTLESIWNHRDNGTYTISLLNGRVADTDGNTVAATTLGTFLINVPSPDPIPTVGVTANNVYVKGGTTYTFTAYFDDDTSINIATLGNDDFVVTGPNGFTTNATLVPGSINPAFDAASVTAQYQFTTPGGSWDHTDVGLYTITMQPNSVWDNDAVPNAVPGGVADTMFVDIQVPLLGRFGNKVKLTLTEPDGTEATFSLAGPGWGEVLNNDGEWLLKLHDTTDRSSVTIKVTNGPLDLYEVEVPSGLKAFNAQMVDLLGTFSVDGDLGSLKVAHIKNAVATINGKLGATTIASMENSLLSTADSILKVVLNSMWQSTIYAGVLSAGRPAAAGDFNQSVSIGTLAFNKGPIGFDMFVRSTVAAASIKNVTMRNVKPDGASEFGIVSTAVTRYTRFQDNVVQTRLAKLGAGVFDDFLPGPNNYMVRVV